MYRLLRKETVMIKTFEQLYDLERALNTSGWWIKSIGKDHAEQEHWWVMLFRKEYLTRHGKGLTVEEALENATTKEEISIKDWTLRRQNKKHEKIVKSKQRSEDVFNKLFDDLDNKE